MLWMISTEKHISRKSKFYPMHQQNMSCWWERLQSLEFQNPVAAGGVSGGASSFWQAFWIALLSFLLSLLFPLTTTTTKYLLLRLERNVTGNYFHFHILDPHGLHILPQTTEWSSSPPQQYLLTLGFRNKQIGKILEKLPSRKLPIFSGTPTCLIAVIAQEWPPQCFLEWWEQGSGPISLCLHPCLH